MEWSVIVFVPRFTCITPQIISLSISSCGASLLITVVRLMDMWILDLLLPHSSNISLALVPSSFFPLLSFSCLLFVADCHVNFPPFLSSLHSHFVDCCDTFFRSTLLDTLTFPLFLCTLTGTALGKHGSLLLIIDRVPLVSIKERVTLVAGGQLTIVSPSASSTVKTSSI